MHLLIDMAATTFVMVFVALCFTLAVGPVLTHLEPTPKLHAPYIPTSQPVINKMLDLAGVNENDVLYDLGCGDGSIVIAAAKDYGARAVGIDLNPRRIAAANANAKIAGVEQKAKFLLGDLFLADVSSASVVTLYLLPDINRKLRPLLWRQLRVGSRVASHDFDMGPEWPAEEILSFGHKTLYFWTITDIHKKAALEYSQST